MIKPIDRVKVGIGLLITSIMILTPIVSLATEVGHVAEPLNGEYPCQTECKLNHNHQTEVCEIEYYGRFLNWTAIPFAWEYNYNNEDACWYHGMWFDGMKYTTPKGTFDTDVRHKIALHCDGEYLYLDVIQASANRSNGIGSDLKFTIDGQVVAFRLASEDGGVMNPGGPKGTHKLLVKHEGGSESGHNVVGSESYLYINDTGYNSEYEVRIPLTQLKIQNPNVDLDNINEISFFSNNIMYKPLVIAGISTYPYILGLFCAIGVGFMMYKKVNKRKG